MCLCCCFVAVTTLILYHASFPLSTTFLFFVKQVLFDIHISLSFADSFYIILLCQKLVKSFFTFFIFIFQCIKFLSSNNRFPCGECYNIIDITGCQPFFYFFSFIYFLSTLIYLYPFLQQLQQPILLV